MKKIVYTFLCILIGMSIGIQLIYNDDNRLSAAVDDNGREKIVDFDVMGETIGDQSIIAATETGRLYYSGGRTLSPTMLWGLMVDVNGQPLERVTKVVLSPEVYSSSSRPYGGGMALRDDNTLYMWGTNRYGQFGLGTTSMTYTKPFIVDPKLPGKITSMLATQNAYFLVMDNGDVYASGDNTLGQLGDGTYDATTTFKKINIDDVKKLTRTIPSTVYALKNDGTIYTWGSSIYDGVKRQSKVNTPTKIHVQNGIDYFTDVVDINANLSNKSTPALAVLVQTGNTASTYVVGRQPYVSNTTMAVGLNSTISGLQSVSSVSMMGAGSSTVGNALVNVSFIGDGKVYKNGSECTSYYTGNGNIIKIRIKLY